MENTKLKSFKDLIVWQKSSDLVTLVYKQTVKFPQSEIYGLSNQMRRAAISISSNIAEGFKRSHLKEKNQFYNIAYGSTAELESQIENSKNLNYIDADEYKAAVVLNDEIARMLNVLIKKTKNRSLNPDQKGQLLLEILIVTSIAAVIVALGANFIYISLRSSKAASERNVAAGLLQETMEAVSAATTEKWQNLFNLNHGASGGSNDYHPIQTSGKWDISSVGAQGQENVVINGITYIRYFHIQHVCRETASTRNITGITDSSGNATTCAETAAADVYDPNTEKVSAIVSWGSGDSLSISEYFAGRWRNKATNQTTWSSETSSNIDKTNNEIKLCTGGC